MTKGSIKIEEHHSWGMFLLIVGVQFMTFGVAPLFERLANHPGVAVHEVDQAGPSGECSSGIFQKFVAALTGTGSSDRSS
jgi:hypothetical protein